MTALFPDPTMHRDTASLPLPGDTLVTRPEAVSLSAHTPALAPLGIPPFFPTPPSIAILPASIRGPLLSGLTPLVTQLVTI